MSEAENQASPTPDSSPPLQSGGVRAKLMVVDDERNIRRTLKMILEGEGFAVVEGASAEEGLRLMGEDPADIILLDIKLPGMDGIELLGRLRKDYSGCEVIMISGHATIHDAVEATRLGAYDVLEKPLDRDRVILSVQNCLDKLSLRRQLSHFTERLEEQYEIIGASLAITSLFEDIKKVAPTNGRVLITGESGTGKELVARAVHRMSKRASGPFIKVNCAAIPAELIESELFGYERGAFTGAVGKKKGQFELASGGTLFLDEIGDMSLNAQAKVLRVLQTGELTHVGGERLVQVDVRVIAATNRELQTMVAAGQFREDLYFRLNVVPIRCAPLRERLDDVPVLFARFVETFSAENGFKPKDIDPAVFQKLRRYYWPGNVRELKNVVERMVIMGGDRIGADDVPEHVSGGSQAVDVRRFDGLTLKDLREEVERDFVKAKLEEYGWNITKASEALGIERTNLHKKIKQLGIKRAGE